MTRTTFWLTAVGVGGGMCLFIRHETHQGPGTGDAMDLLATIALLALIVAGAIVAVAVARRPAVQASVLFDVEEPAEVSGWWYCQLYGSRQGARRLLKEGRVHYPAGSSTAVEAEVIRRFATKYEGQLEGMRLRCTARPVEAPTSAKV